MKSKDQIILEKLYNRILSEKEESLDFDTLEFSDVDASKIVHDIFNKIQPYLFEFDGEEFKTKFKEITEKIIEKLMQGLNKRIQQIY